MSSIGATFAASLRSVGTAATLASVGFYMDRRGFVPAQGGKKVLALLSQQVTIPAFLFTKIVYCRQDGSNEQCPSVTDNLADVWMLLFWPIFVVGCGLMVGWAAAVLSKTPPWQRRAVLASCAFGNSTGLPITLLTVIHANFPKSSEIGGIDSTLYLSVYLLLYPVLQWGIGGWLLAPEEDGGGAVKQTSVRHILNMQPSQRRLKGSGESKAETLIRELSMDNLQMHHKAEEGRAAEKSSLLPTSDDTAAGESTARPSQSSTTNPGVPKDDIIPLTETIARVASKAFQPPVVGALLGMIVSATPLRGLFVDMNDRDDDAPLEWFFDGLYSVGQAAVPVNMCILGINLSMATRPRKMTSKDLMSSRTMFATVMAKMLIMPIIGILVCIILKNYIWHVPDEIDGAFYLVAMIVFITPTANTVMVMVELSGSGSKEGMARLIAWQYAVAPILLSMSVAMVVSVASKF